MPSYDASHYSPSGTRCAEWPCAISTGTGTLLPNVQLLIDSGGDVTLLPKHAVELLGVRPVSGQEYQLVGFDGTASTVAQAIDLDMIFLNKAYRGRYLLVDSEHGVLGAGCVLSNVAMLLR